MINRDDEIRMLTTWLEYRRTKFITINFGLVPKERRVVFHKDEFAKIVREFYDTIK